MLKRAQLFTIRNKITKNMTKVESTLSDTKLSTLVHFVRAVRVFTQIKLWYITISDHWMIYVYNRIES